MLWGSLRFKKSIDAVRSFFSFFLMWIISVIALSEIVLLFCFETSSQVAQASLNPTMWSRLGLTS